MSVFNILLSNNFPWLTSFSDSYLPILLASLLYYQKSSIVSSPTYNILVVLFHTFYMYDSNHIPIDLECILCKMILDDLLIGKMDL